MATLQELLTQKAALERQIAEASSSARTEAIRQIHALMAENSLSAADFTVAPASTRRAAPKGERAKVAAKYRNPETGATWSGRGLKPRWLAQQIAQGKTLESFAI